MRNGHGRISPQLPSNQFCYDGLPCTSLRSYSGGTSGRSDRSQVWVIAHRGASGHSPENTMAAFRRAVELGARFIETDLHLSRDGEIVAIHDPTLDRTTSGRGPVMAHSLDELRQLDAGSWFSPEFAGERIPTLDEILSFA